MFKDIKIKSKYLLAFMSIIILAVVVNRIILYTDTYGIESILRKNNQIGKLIYFLICFTQPIILPLPEPVTIITGSIVFGENYGFLIGLIGTILGIATMFFISRIGGQKLANRMVAKKQLEKYKKIVEKNELILLIILFILPILPDEVICIGAGISGCSFKKFMSVSILAKLMTTFTYSKALNLSKYLGLKYTLTFSILTLITIVLIKKIKAKKTINCL